MARDRYYASGETPAESDPQAAAFAQRLNRQLLQRGWKQADLVRKAQDHTPEGVVFKRHLVSSWMRGKHLPSPVNLDILAKALDVETSDLVPPGAAVIVKSGDRDVQVSMSTSGMARIKLDLELPAEIALQIMAIVNKAAKVHA